MRVKEGEASLTYANRRIEDLFANMEALLAKYGPVVGQMGITIPNISIPKYDQESFHAELPLPSNHDVGRELRPTGSLGVGVGFAIRGMECLRFFERVF